MKVPGRTEAEKKANYAILFKVSIGYMLDAMNGKVHYDHRTRAEGRYLETCYYRLKWQKVKNHGLRGY